MWLVEVAVVVGKEGGDSGIGVSSIGREQAGDGSR